MEVGCECLDVVDVVTELSKAGLGLSQRPAETDIRVKDFSEDGLVEPVPQVVVEPLDKLELLVVIHSLSVIRHQRRPHVPVWADMTATKRLINRPGLTRSVVLSIRSGGAA